MGKILIFLIIIVVVVIGISYLFFRHEINDFIHKGEVSNNKKEFEYLIKRKERERDALGNSVGDEYEKQQLEYEIQEYKEMIQKIRQGKKE